jgi:hypothetical protein
LKVTRARPVKGGFRMELRTGNWLLFCVCVVSWRQARQGSERQKLYVLGAYLFEVECKLVDGLCACVVRVVCSRVILVDVNVNAYCYQSM